MSRFGPVGPMSRYTFKDRPLFWFVWGNYPDGRVAIGDSEGTVLEGPFALEDANRIINAHNAVVGYLEDCYHEVKP